MNKTTDGRIIDKRVEIDKDKLKELIFNVKKTKNLTWKEFANILDIGEQTLRNDWINKTETTIPLFVFKRILRMSHYKMDNFEKYIKIKNAFWGQRVSKEKPVRFPDTNSKEFAEFYGVMLGDGCIFSNMKGFSISGDKLLERKYYENYLSPLITELFGSRPSIYIDKNTRTIKLVLYSKKICNFLSDNGFPVGVKSKGNMKFPKFITRNRSNLSACLRGLIDTDGSLSSHPNSKIMIHISVTNKDLKKSALEGLNKLGIKAGAFNKGIMIYAPKKIKQVNERIGFSNYKNNLKYDRFLETGVVPSTKETEMFLR